MRTWLSSTPYPVEIKSLKTYREVLAQYHLRPETKFLNGSYLDQGLTQRRHIVVAAIRNIGKEANHWEEQFYLGIDEGLIKSVAKRHFL
jgi:hypothetical protein